MCLEGCSALLTSLYNVPSNGQDLKIRVVTFVAHCNKIWPKHGYEHVSDVIAESRSNSLCSFEWNPIS